MGVFYKGGEYADRNPNFVDCAENALGIRGWLESQGHQYVVTEDKDGPNSGDHLSLQLVTSGVRSFFI